MRHLPHRLLLAGLGSLLLANVQAAEPAGNITGRWVTASGNLEVDILPCEQAMCGIVARVLANRSMSNPGMEMGAQPAIGLQILSDVKPKGEQEWQGRIFNRENGKTYDCILTAASPDEIKVHAYVFLPLFGQTQTWRRASLPN
jgi:uncharacterized protein (DUF2147 family)